MSKIEIAKAVSQNIAPLTSSEILHEEIEQLSTAEAAQSWLMLDLVEEMVQARKAKLRERLMDEALNHGKVNVKGGYHLTVPGIGSFVRERREQKIPKVEALIELLQKKGIQIDEGCDEQTMLVVNPSKIQHLVETGKLDAEEVELIKNTTWALRPFPNEEIEELLAKARERMEAPAAVAVLAEEPAKALPAKGSKAK